MVDPFLEDKKDTIGFAHLYTNGRRTSPQDIPSGATMPAYPFPFVRSSVEAILDWKAI